jgi:hypothetical protein
MANELPNPGNKDEMERARFHPRRMFEMDMEHNLAPPPDESKTGEEATGRTEGRREVARNLKKAKTISNEEIAKYAGLRLSDVEKL